MAKINKTLPRNIVSCVLGSNDLKLLMHRMNISADNLLPEYESFSRANFLSTHYQFTNISETYADPKLN